MYKIYFIHNHFTNSLEHYRSPLKMKKNTIPFLAILLLSFLSLSTLKAQVKIGDNPNVIDPSSILELESTTRALVLTRVTDAQMQAILPLQGAVVYNIDQQCVFYFDLTTWKNLCSGGGQVGDGATLVNNNDGTYTFTDANGLETLISFNNGNGGSLTGQPGSIFFAGTDTNASENNNELFWDTITNRLGIGTNTFLNNKLSVNGDIGATQLLLNNGNQDPTPLVIRGSGTDQRMIAFQDENQGTTVFNFNFKGGGFNIDDLNQSHRMFIKVLGGIGILTREPTETLDIAGSLRVRQLDPSLTTDNFVTVDANGVFHRSATISSAGKTASKKNEQFSARWTNGPSRIGLKTGKTLAPVFVIESFKDGSSSVFENKNNLLVVKLSGRYNIGANISLIGTNISATGQIVNINARVYVNGLPAGSLNAAANNGSSGKSVLSSIHISELLELKANDVITIVIATDAISESIYFNHEGTSNFSITKLN